MKKLIILLVVLMVMPSLAFTQSWPNNSYSDTVVINSLPFSISGQTDRAYRVASNLSTSGGAISIWNSSYVKIIGDGYTLTYDSQGNGDNIGLSIGGSSHHVVLENLVVTQALTTGEYGSPGGSNCTALQLAKCEYVRIANCDFHTSGHSSRVVDGADGAKKAIEIFGGNYTSYSASFDGRMSNDGAVMVLYGNPAGVPLDDADYHFWIHKVTVDSCPHSGLLIAGVAWVDSNYVSVDSRNGKGTSTANAHALADYNRVFAGSRFTYNTIRSGRNHRGGRGMYFNFAAGTANNPIEMAYNDIRVSEGPNEESGEGESRGLRLRWGCFYMNIHHNYIEVAADTDPNTAWRGSGAHGIWFGAIGEENSDTSSYNEFHHNTVIAIGDTTGNFSSGVTRGVFAFTVEQYHNARGNKSYDNHFIGNCAVVQLGNVNGGCQEWLSINDKIEWLPQTFTDKYGHKGTVVIGAAGFVNSDNTLVDARYVGGSSGDIGNGSGGSDKELFSRRTINVQVTSSQNSLPVRDATVRVFNTYGNASNNSSAVTTKTSNGFGQVIDTVTYRYDRWVGNSYSDSVFSDFVIEIEKDGQTNQTTLSIEDAPVDGNGNVSVPLTLNVAGEQVANVVPTTPTPFSPYNGSNVSAIKPTLVINNSSDANGDQLTYEFEVYNADASILISSQGGVAQGNSTTTWTLPVNLQDNTSYQWRVRSNDGITTSPWMAMSAFTVVLQGDNTAPTAPVILNPKSGSVIKSTQPVLAVINGRDPEGAALTYEFELLNEAGNSLITSASGISEGVGYTSWTVSDELEDLTTYSWHARCFDGSAYSGWTQTALMSIDVNAIINNPPSPPIHASPVNGEIVVTSPIVLSVLNSMDSENDDLTYDFHLYDNAGLTGAIEQIFGITETGSQTSVTLSFNPVQGATYYWQVQAHDGSGSSSFSGPTTFTYNTFGVGSGALIASVHNPANGSTVSANPPTFVAGNTAPGPSNTYYFELASDVSFTNIIVVSGAVPEGNNGETAWQPSSELQLGTYYWHVRANSESFTAAAGFVLGEIIIAYPNPVHFLQGEQITFTLPDDAVDLLIQTVSGETVLLKQGISGNWDWNGANASGNLVSIGIYSWFVHQTGDNGKIVVKP